jgi:hypothetical protein
VRYATGRADLIVPTIGLSNAAIKQDGVFKRLGRPHGLQPATGVAPG